MDGKIGESRHQANDNLTQSRKGPAAWESWGDKVEAANRLGIRQREYINRFPENMRDRVIEFLKDAQDTNRDLDETRIMLEILEKDKDKEYQKIIKDERNIMGVQQKTIVEKQEEIDEQRVTIAEQQEEINEQRAILAEQQREINEQRAILAEQQREINEQRAILAEQQREINEQRDKIDDSRENLNKMQKIIIGFNDLTNEQRVTIASLEAHIQFLERTTDSTKQWAPSKEGE